MPSSNNRFERSSYRPRPGDQSAAAQLSPTRYPTQRRRSTSSLEDEVPTVMRLGLSAQAHLLTRIDILARGARMSRSCGRDGAVCE